MCSSDLHFRKALPNVITLGQHFRANGYFVQGMGKIYHGGLDDAPTWSVPWQTPKATKYALPDNLALDNRNRGSGADADGPQPSGSQVRGPAFECADVPDDTYQDGKVADLAIATLRQRSQQHGVLGPAPLLLRSLPLRPLVVECPRRGCLPAVLR